MASRAPPSLQAQLDALMRAERAEVERKNEKVLALLLAKDAEIDSLTAQLDAAAEQRHADDDDADSAHRHPSDREQRMQRRIDDLSHALAEAQAAASDAEAAAAAAQQSSEQDMAHVSALLARQEELISERDAVDSNNANLRFQIQASEQSARDSAAALRRERERAESLARQLRDAEAHAAARDNGPEVARQQEQIEHLIRELHAARESRSAAEAVEASDPYSAASHQQQQRQHFFIFSLHLCSLGAHERIQLRLQ